MGVIGKETVFGYTGMKINRHIKDKDFVHRANYTAPDCENALCRSIYFSFFEVQITYSSRSIKLSGIRNIYSLAL